jgi:site-specific DNA recombinase
MTSSTRRRTKLQLVQSVASTLQRALIYCRVSTDEQADQHTTQLQLDYLEGRYRPDFEGLGETPMQLIDTIVDEGWSGALPLEDRPGGSRVLELARGHQVDVVLLYKLDRLGRKASVLLNAHDLLEAEDVAITSATEPFDTRPGPMQAFGKFVFTLLASIAEFERSTIAMRTMGGKLRVAKEEQFVNGQVPFGYKVGVAGLLVPNDTLVPEVGVSEAELVTELFTRIAEGESTYQLADWLFDLGVRTPRRWWSKKRAAVTESPEALPWNNVRVWETIRNETYRGDRFLSFAGADHTQHPPAIVTEKLWEEANTKMQERSAWKRDRDDAYTYLLRGKIHCDCGMLYTGAMSNKHPYYKCNGTKKRNLRRSGQDVCTARMLPAPLVEAAVWADLAWKVRNPTAALEQARDRLRERQEQTIDHQARRDELQKQLANVEQSNRYLRHQLTRGQFRPGRGPEQIEEDLVATERELARVQGQLAELGVVLGVTAEMERQFAAAVPLLAQMRGELDAIEVEQDRPKMRLIMDKLVSRVTVADKRARYPDVNVDYAFAVGGNTSTISPVVNIKSVVVTDPSLRVA